MTDPSSLEAGPRSAVDQPTYNPETFGRSPERTRFLGSWRFIAWMSILIPGLGHLQRHRDRPGGSLPFIFLTLLLSLQASYAAPLIPAGAEPAGRPRPHPDQEDRERTERLIADTEYLARRSPHCGSGSAKS